ncbi:TetR/AcrR family transcriptional regulator [Neobacillus sp. CF12]|uniref:TetR/AcrR family transcriptional regulator n=1 Tax=Neobacillus sp. CF12 TaxID=3055864 RepID=UPI0025A220B2|nr:TetR/AcrR family transcriptional regulator [Neobacillus sp. CF12]MDM5326470.1 TetR/AcrR family transcriptional regulator [Neobacillus sp. CF12]
MSSFRVQKMAKKKQEILRSAAAVLAEKGYQGTTMEEIAAKLLMTKGSMYYYFKNKDDLLYQCHLMIMEICIDGIEKVVTSDRNPIEKLSRAIKEHILLATSEKSMFMVLGKPNHNFTEEQLQEVLELRKNYSKYFDRIIHEGIDTQVFAHVDVKMVRLIILGALNWIQDWYDQNGSQSAEEIAEAYAAYLLKMVMKEKE